MRNAPKHGHSPKLGKHSRTYNAWRSMKQRCGNPNKKSYPNYGGRGIKVCERWLSFENFLADMGVCPEGMTIDRIAVDGGYEPSNCRWLPRDQQSKNRRNVRPLLFNGKTQTVSDWAHELGVPRATLWNRIRRGWPLEDVLTANKFNNQYGK